MTETEWLTSTDATSMMRWLWTTKNASERKGRLFAVGCCRRVWARIGQKGKRAVEAAERFADDGAQQVKLADARHVARDPRYAGDAAALATTHPFGQFAACETPHEASVAQGTLEQQRQERVSQAALARCIFANPFRSTPVVTDSACNPTALALATAIYNEQAWDRVAILADALEEAGCANEEILSHCRGPGPHVRGCWVVDLILGRE
jgi:hypothetical protein